jgi:hypothetical protein
LVANNNNTEGIPSPDLNESLKDRESNFALIKKKHLNISFVTVTIDFLLCMYKYIM